MLNSNNFSTCPHNMVNFSPLTAKIGSLVWGTPANFNGFRVLASLYCSDRRRSQEANHTLNDVWPSPWLIHYIRTFGGSCTLSEFCLVQNSLYVQVMRSSILAALYSRHSSSGRQPNFAAWYKEWIYTELSQRVPPIFGWATITLGHI